jgi:prepilin-type N-terminal cleavage/methylation domain-containing protein
MKETRNKERKGFTLVELIVTIAIFTITITIAVGGFTNALRTQREVAALISAESNVSLALEQMTREVRTGYLFCHDPGATTPSSSCADPTTGAACVVSTDAATGDPIWTCNAINYYNAASNEVNYALVKGALVKKDSSVDGDAAQSITGSNVSVKYLHFILFGNLEGDHWTPRITIALGLTSSSTDPAVENDVFNLETTVSARTIDCIPSGTTLSC